MTHYTASFLTMTVERRTSDDCEWPREIMKRHASSKDSYFLVQLSYLSQWKWYASNPSPTMPDEKPVLRESVRVK